MKFEQQRNKSINIELTCPRSNPTRESSGGLYVKQCCSTMVLIRVGTKILVSLKSPFVMFLTFEINKQENLKKARKTAYLVSKP